MAISQSVRHLCYPARKVLELVSRGTHFDVVLIAVAYHGGGSLAEWRVMKLKCVLINTRGFAFGPNFDIAFEIWYGMV